jgi:hypothetical protein
MPKTEFATSDRHADGYNGQCRRCVNDKRNARRQGKKRAPAKRSTASLLWQYASIRAAQRGLDFTIAIDDIIIPEFCPVFGMRLERGVGQAVAQSPSIDRKDPTKGYTKENIWVISRRANIIKSDATLNELEMLVTALKKFSL